MQENNKKKHKYLVMSKKSSTFAAAFEKSKHLEPLAIAIEGLQVTGYRLREPARIVVNAPCVITNP